MKNERRDSLGPALPGRTLCKTPAGPALSEGMQTCLSPKNKRNWAMLGNHIGPGDDGSLEMQMGWVTGLRKQ